MARQLHYQVQVLHEYDKNTISLVEWLPTLDARLLAPWRFRTQEEAHAHALKLVAKGKRVRVVEVIENVVEDHIPGAR